MRTVFLAGGTGYMGRRLAEELVGRGHSVRALARRGSEGKVPAGCTVILGNALDAASYRQHIAPAETFVHLVGVSHPNPSKARQFREIDLVSLKAAVGAAVEAGCRHFIYVSVAQPAPVMKEYLAVRAECERIIADAVRSQGLVATILRPWYVLGPGHYWPYVLLPLYWLCERLPSTREPALRLGLVTIDQMLTALCQVIESPAEGVRIVDVPAIRQSGMQATGR